MTTMLGSGRGQVNVALRYLAAAVCAASAGVHAALVPEHVHEGGIRLGGAFAVSAVLLAAASLVVRRPRRDPWALRAAVAVLLGVALAYLLSRTTGIPLLITTPEDTDPLGAVTSAAEVVGALACTVLIARKDIAREDIA